MNLNISTSTVLDNGSRLLATELPSAPIAVIVCDTQPIAIEGLRWLLESTGGFRFLGGATDLEDASELLHSNQDAVVVLDKAFGAAVIGEWLSHEREAAAGLAPGGVVPGAARPAVAIWGTGIGEAEALRLLQAGARGILRRTASTESMLTCLRTVAAGGSWMEEGIFGDSQRILKPRHSSLTNRERQITELVERGMRNRDIARALGIQTGTVKIHLKHIFEKTGVRGRYGLAITGLRQKGTLAFPVPEKGTIPFPLPPFPVAGVRAEIPGEQLPRALSA
jgi:DNA-binding NarL/FixJ family response regulator